MTDDQVTDSPPPSGDEPRAGAAEPARAPADDDELLNDQADAAEDFLNGLLDVLDLDGEAEADIIGDTIEVDLSGPDMGLLIGRHGATLEALHELVRATVQHQTSSFARTTLDINGYRDRQRSMLSNRVSKIADEVRQTGREVELEPMSAFERKVVHDTVADIEGVSTFSEGESPERYVVIRPD